MKIDSGIYEIRSPSGKRYIGSSIDMRKRWNLHLKRFRSGKHHNPGLMNAWRKYAGNLSFTRLLICLPCDLLAYEQLAIDGLKPEYNAARIAGSRLGMKSSKETRAKIAAAHLGRKLTADQRAKLSIAHTGLPGRPLSESQRAALLAGRRSTKATEETKRKISESKKGAIISPEHRKKISMALKGRVKPPFSAEHRAAIGAAQKGKKQSPERIAARIAGMARARKMRKHLIPKETG